MAIDLESYPEYQTTVRHSSTPIFVSTHLFLLVMSQYQPISWLSRFQVEQSLVCIPHWHHLHPRLDLLPLCKIKHLSHFSGRAADGAGNCYAFEQEGQYVEGRVLSTSVGTDTDSWSAF